MSAPSSRVPFVLAVHGGAGVIARDSLSPAQEALIRAGLNAALAAGEAVLAREGTAIDAVTAAVCALEDCPLFNAGRGSVLNRAGICEMDASIMNGADRRAGAVAAVRRPRNPVLAARAVMERSTHVLLAGEGADAFAAEQGLALEAAGYFITEARRNQWQRVMGRLQVATEPPSLWALERKSDAFGTVGAVALDRAGNVAAATSTGGLAGKLPGRVGDSPLIGAGTWAENATCAVSATGHGEHFIRHVVAHEVAARIRHSGCSLAMAARDVVMDDLRRAGGDGGLIAVDRAGNVAMPFNTSGMYRGEVREGGARCAAIFAGEASRDGD